MPKILKFIIICILAFFIFDGTLVCASAIAQDAKAFENGLRVIVEEDHRNPIVVFSFFIDGGSAFEEEYSGSGISHLIEHMLFKGTKKYPPGTIADILHIYGGDIDAFTSHDYTGLRITILKEHADIALDVLKEMLTLPRFDKKELKKEMLVIEREMDLNKDDPGRRISRLTFANAYTRHPYRIPVIGYKENFKRLKRKDLIKFFKERHVPERTVIAVVGDIDKETMLDKLEALFGNIPRGNNMPIALPEEPDKIAPSFVEEKMDIDGAYLNIAFHSTGLLDRDLYALDLLSFILGQGESSILNREVRIKKGLALSISAYNYTPKEKGLFIISSVLEEAHVKEAMSEILKQLESVKENGVKEEALVMAKNNFLAGYIYKRETIESKADDLALGELLAGDSVFFDLYIEGIKAVSLADIQEAANRYLRKENMTVAVLSRSGSALTPDIKEAVKEHSRKIKKIILKNNLPVLISEDPSLPILSISLLLKGGLRAEDTELNGISRLTSLMLMDGTDSMTREEIASFYESKGMSISTYSGNNSLGISVNCLKEHTEDAIKLLYDLSARSIFPEEELERERRELIAAIEMQDNTPFSHGHRLLKELLFKRHPYRFQTIGTIESINGIEREDMVRFHKNILAAENMVLGLSGDCDADNITALVEKYFSEIPSKGRELIPPEKETPMSEVRELLVKAGKKQSLVLLGFRGIDIYDKDRYALEVMMDMLSSSSGILFKNIRGGKGLSYATGAFQISGLDPGYIAVYTLTAKQNIDKVKDGMFKEMASFTKKEVTDEELVKSKNHLKAMRRIAMQANSSFIFSASLDELYGLGYDYHKDYDKNIDGVTGEDVKRAAQELLTLDKCALLILEGRE